MSQVLNSLRGRLTDLEREMEALPGELDSIVARLEPDKLTNLLFCLDQDCNKLYDEYFNPQQSNAPVVFPFILFPDGVNGPVYRRITNADVAKWRQAYKTKLHVVMGKGRVEVIAASELAREYKTTVSQVVFAAQQQGYIVLGWDQYQKLLDEIGKVIGGDKEQSKTIEPSDHTAHIAIGIPVIATESQQEVKVLPKSSPSNFDKVP